MTSRRSFRRPALLAIALAWLAAMAATPARADRCDNVASQLAHQIDGMTVGKTTAGVIYLSHPQAKQLTLGCSARNLKAQLYARADSRKPKAAFLDLVAGAAAIIFTQPKTSMRKGAARCLGRLGLFRNEVSTRYRRLDMRCSRTKTDSSITISQRVDE